MRARLARPRQSTRGRLVVPVAAAAAVALVGGAVVASPDTPTLRGDVQTASLTGSSVEADAEAGAVAFYSFDVAAYVASEFDADAELVGVTDLPDGLSWDGEGTISGDIAPGEYSFQVTVNQGAEDETFDVPITVEQASGSSAGVEGSLGAEAQAGGQAGGQITTGSDGTDAILGAVAGIVSSLGGDAGSVTDLATGSTGGGETNPDNPENPGGPLGSLATGQLDLGSLGGAETNPDNPENPGGSLETGSDGAVGGDGDVELETGGELQTGSAGDTETGGEVTIPGSTTTADTGSLGNLAPGLAVTGAALLGLAGLSLVLNGGSSTPGATSSLPALPGSSGNGSVAPTVAAGAPAPTTAQAPGPTVANGRG